jgi:hypothetical protein
MFAGKDHCKIYTVTTNGSVLTMRHSLLVKPGTDDA